MPIIADLYSANRRSKLWRHAAFTKCLIGDKPHFDEAVECISDHTNRLVLDIFEALAKAKC